MSSGSEDQPGPDQPGQGPFGQQPGWPPPPPPGPYAQPSGGWQPPPPYGPPGPYVQPNAGWPQMAGRRTNSLAIAALCCAIGQVIAGPFAGIAAIVLGVMSLKQIEVSREEGRGMAITGVVLGIVGTLLFVLFLIFAVALFHGMATSFSNQP